MTTEETRAKIRQQAADLRREIEAKEEHRRIVEATPPAYLSRSEGKFRVIAQGMPLCSDKATAAEATAAATAQRVKLAPVYWDGDTATWKPCEGVTTE
jgi:hypothetical protein